MFYAYHTKYSGENGATSLFFDANSPSKEYQLINPVLKLEIGKAGSFTFTIPTTNIEYDKFEDLISFVDVYRVNKGETKLIFSGRVFSHKKDFYNRIEVTCEGLLALFNDSVQYPLQFTGVTLETILRSFLTQHNNFVDDYKKIELGNVNVTDEYMTRLFERTVYTIDRLNDLVDSYGGYMSVRKDQTDNKLYLDYVSSYDDELADQSIHFGDNLLDITQESNIDGFITVIVPYGAQMTNEDGSYYNVDISSVNGGKKELENPDLIAQFGRIVGTVEWPNVTDASILKHKAKQYVEAATNTPSVTISVTAVDMAKANSDIRFFEPGQNILVYSEAHNIARYFVAASQELHLLDPASNRMVLGDQYNGFISQTKNASTSNYNSIVNNETVINDLSVRIENISSGGAVDPIPDSDIDSLFE